MSAEYVPMSADYVVTGANGDIVAWAPTIGEIWRRLKRCAPRIDYTLSDSRGRGILTARKTPLIALLKSCDCVNSSLPYATWVETADSNIVSFATEHFERELAFLGLLLIIAGAEVVRYEKRLLEIKGAVPLVRRLKRRSKGVA